MMEDLSDHYNQLIDTVRLTCPELTRVYMNKSKCYLPERIPVDKHKVKNVFSHCSYCYNIFAAGNHTMRLLSKLTLTNKTRRLTQRHNEDPLCLGKFQRKLVQDYRSESNKVSVTCHLCEKTRKYAGQKRMKRERPIVTETEGLSRKKKRRQLKKLQRKRRLEGQLDEDKNAGLILPAQTQNTSNERVWESNTIDSHAAFSQNAIVSQTARASNDAAKMMVVAEKDPNILLTTYKQKGSVTVASERNNVHNRTGNKGFKSNTILSTKQQPLRFSDAATMQPCSVQKSSNKKKKSKTMCQQLGTILKREQNKQTKGTLADFLSHL